MSPENKGNFTRSAEITEIIGNPPHSLVRWGPVCLFLFVIFLVFISWLTPYYTVVVAPMNFSNDNSVARNHQIEIEIEQKYYALIRPGQIVTIKLVAYPYLRYGLIKSSILAVKEINSKTAKFSITILIPDQIKTTLGYPLKYQLGFNGEANIIVSESNVLSYLVFPANE